MRFSVVESGYDREQVDFWLATLDAQLTELLVRAEAGVASGVGPSVLREEVRRLRELMDPRSPAGGPTAPDRTRLPRPAEQEAAAILTRAREELAAAREEARLVRDQVYAEALQARRDFEAALHERRLREQRADEILRAVSLVPGPQLAGDGDAGGVPATRAASTDPARPTAH